MLRLNQRINRILLLKRYNHYTTLGVDRNASEKDIKKAFRAKSLKCHPDKFPGDAKKETEFKNLSEAYQILSNKKSRNVYDAESASSSPKGQSPPGEFRPEHETYNRFNKRHRDFSNRKYRTEFKSNYERNDEWHRIHEELNRRRYEAWEGRSADFSDFMHGRRGTDFKDFRKWYNEPASPFEEGGKNANWASGFYEKKRYGTADRQEQRFREEMYKKHNKRYEQLIMRKKWEAMIRITALFLAIHIIFLMAREEGMGPYAVQYSSAYQNFGELPPSNSYDITVAEMVRRRVEQERMEENRRRAEAAASYSKSKDT